MSSRAPLALALLAFLCALLWYPLRHAAAFMDDHVFLMLGRHLDAPWPLVTQDSIGSYFFRPLVMGLWWATERAFAGNVALHYAFSIGVHGLNAALLLALLRRLGVSGAVALGAAGVFAAHPATFSAAAWLCIRFDLLAATFGLAALIAVRQLRAGASWRAAVAAVLAAAAAIFSKETGFGVALVVAAALAWPGSPATRRARWAALAAVSLVGLLALGLRPVLLRDVPELREPTHELMLRGIGRFLFHFPEFLVVRQGNRAAVAAWVILLLLLAGSLVGARARRALVQPERAACLAFGLALFAVGIAAPAPIVAQIPIPGYAPAGFDIQPLLSARFFYLPLLGVAIAGAAAADAAAAARPRAASLAALVCLAAVVGLASSSRSIGRDYAGFTRQASGIYASAATAAVMERAALLRPGCKLYFLGTPPPPAPALHFREYADAAVKGALPRGHPGVSCFIQAEHAPWHHFLPAGVAPAQPLETILVGGRPFAPLAVGNLVVHYLKVPPGPQVAQDPAALFFAWGERRFQDVTGDVRAGRRVPAFLDNRPAR